MKIINNYNEMIISIESNDINRLENLLRYCDSRNNLIVRYIENHGTEHITKISNQLQAIAFKKEIAELCSRSDINSRNNTRKVIYIG